ncbi:hypothetical protein F2P39_19915, partial [Acinetobacter baumannii]|nr:hypothetical protein [Acinetobacter baumannii]
SSWSTCHKILHILMFITSFEEQNITYRSCSNLRIHLYYIYSCRAFSSESIWLASAIRNKKAPSIIDI